MPLDHQETSSWPSPLVDQPEEGGPPRAPSLVGQAEEGREGEWTNEREESTRMRWWILGTFAWMTAVNGFSFMNFSTDVEMIQATFHGISASQVNWLYSASLLSCLSVYVPVVAYLDTRNWEVSLFGLLSGIAACWLRLAALAHRSYTLAVVSSVVLGLQTTVLVTSFVQLAERWFPPPLKALATQVCIQANYAGWALGTVMTPQLGSTRTSLMHILFFQAVLCSLSLPLFLVVWKSPPSLETPTLRSWEKAPYSRSSSVSGFSPSVLAELEALAGKPQFILQCVCHSTLTGISFTLPAVQNEVFHRMGLSPTSGGWASFAFILAGVAAGLTFGRMLNTTAKASQSIKFFYLVNAVAMTLMLAFELYFLRYHVRPGVAIAVLVALALPAGASSLAFLGPAMNVVVALTSPINEVYSSSTVEFGVQIMGALLTQLSSSGSGYTVLAIASWSSTLVILLGFRGKYEHEVEDQEQEDAWSTEEDQARLRPATPEHPGNSIAPSWRQGRNGYQYHPISK